MDLQMIKKRLVIVQLYICVCDLLHTQQSLGLCRQMIHRHVIDTALLYRKEFGQKFKLKVLAETVLK